MTNLKCVYFWFKQALGIEKWYLGTKFSLKFWKFFFWKNIVIFLSPFIIDHLEKTKL